jgi:tetratricopeptide (TPR) repeat protein
MSARLLTVLPFVALLVTLVAPADAGKFSWKNEATNLQVLEGEVTPRSLRNVMLGFTNALGVRCSYCHDDAEGDGLDEIDFASDAKPAKETARLMMDMVAAINSEHLKSLGSETHEVMEVRCVTCHHSQKRPALLHDVLDDVITADGVDAGVKRYRDLRERYHGGFTYDFGVGTLNRLGYRLLAAEKVDDAITIFRLNVEQFPHSGNVFDSLAEAYATKGQTELAIAHYQASLVRDPDNRNALSKITELRIK